MVTEASIISFFVTPSQNGASLATLVDVGTRDSNELTIRWSYFRTGSIQSVSAGTSSVNSAGESSGSLSELNSGTGYTARAELLHRGSVVDAAVANFTTTSPDPFVFLQFISDDGSTNFRMQYSGVTSISVSVDIGGGIADIDHVRSGLFPSIVYNHNANRSSFPPQSIRLELLDGLRVNARGPGGTITVDYGAPGNAPSTLSFYRNRGWSVEVEVDRQAAFIKNMRRIYGPGSYT